MHHYVWLQVFIYVIGTLKDETVRFPTLLVVVILKSVIWGLLGEDPYKILNRLSQPINGVSLKFW